MTHALVAEPHSSDQVQTGALQAVMRSFSGTPAQTLMARAAWCVAAPIYALIEV